MNTYISRFGISIGKKKYLDEYTPFTSVSLWLGQLLFVGLPQHAKVICLQFSKIGIRDGPIIRADFSILTP